MPGELEVIHSLWDLKEQRAEEEGYFKDIYGDEKPQRAWGLMLTMIFAYVYALCLKHFNPTYIQEYQISKIYSC